MARYTTVIISSNASAKLCNIHRRRPAYAFIATVLVSGTFGGGTVALGVSPDNGTTIFPIKDETGNAQSVTALGAMLTKPLGDSNSNGDGLSLWVTVSGATSPNISINTFDNN